MVIIANVFQSKHIKITLCQKKWIRMEGNMITQQHIVVINMTAINVYITLFNAIFRYTSMEMEYSFLSLKMVFLNFWKKSIRISKLVCHYAFPIYFHHSRGCNNYIDIHVTNNVDKRTQEKEGGCKNV